MANEEQLIRLTDLGVEEWNRWREQNPSVRPDLTVADLAGLNLGGANLTEAYLDRADLTEAYLYKAYLTGAYLGGAILGGANLTEAYLTGANFIGANLTGANLTGANLTGADLYKADLTGADLTGAILIQVNFERAQLAYCKIYGISAWDLKFSNETNQRNLIIESATTNYLTVDAIEAAQFIHLLRTSERTRRIEWIRKVINKVDLQAEDVAKSLAKMPDQASNGALIEPEEKEENPMALTEKEQNGAQSMDEKKREMRSTMANLPLQTRNEVLKDLNDNFLPSQRVTDKVWQIIIWAFAIVFVVSTTALCAGALWMRDTAEIQMLLTVVTTVAGILAGFISGRASSRQTPS